jgi:hypothetical protein
VTPIGTGEIERRLVILENIITGPTGLDRFVRDEFAKQDGERLSTTKYREERELLDKKRARIHFWWLGILSALIVGFLLWFMQWTVAFFSTHHISENMPSFSQPSADAHNKAP